MTEVTAGVSLLSADGAERPLDAELTIGRDQRNAVVVESRTVSRVHARLFEAEGRWFVEDCGSANGTLLNGQRIPPHTAIRLRHADRLQVGPAAFVVSNSVESWDPDQTEPGPALPIVPEQGLSALQQRVVQILCEAWLRRGELDRLPSNEEIAARLGTPGAGHTVKAALRRIYAKAGVSQLPAHAKRRALCRVARTRGWI